MRRLLALVSVVMCCVGMHAEQVTLQQAKQVAQQYLKEGRNVRLVARNMQTGESGEECLMGVDKEDWQPLYIFSRGEGEGFVIVSGDDLLPQIIGYTDRGDWDEKDAPEALKDMMAYYSEAAVRLRTDQQMQAEIRQKKVVRKAAGTKDISPLMTTHWHQSWPYNNLCPRLKSNNNLAATGCVATAASQIIYYWRKDCYDRTQQTTPTYGYGDAPATADYQVAKGTPMKWSLMKDSYAGSEPEEYTTAVATLVATVGMSAWLTYGSSTSGQIDNCRNVFAAQFGLNGGTTVWKGSYSQASWEKLIVQDLEEGRPILYSGVHPSNGGHAVVVDGYKASSNLFHFNFGWGSEGGYDGYYTVDDVTGMNGFCESQGMVYHIYPSKANIAADLTIAFDSLMSRVSNKVKATVTNNGTLGHKGFKLYALSGTSKPTTTTTAQSSDLTTVVQPGETRTLELTAAPTGTSKYTLYLCDANAKVLAQLKDIPTKASVADLSLESITTDDGGDYEEMTIGGETVRVMNIYNNSKTNVTAHFTNGRGGTRCMPSVKGLFAAYDSEAGAFATASSRTKKNVTFDPGETGDIVFDLSGLKTETVYRFSIEPKVIASKTYDLAYATADTVVYFQMKGAGLTGETTAEGEMTLEGHYNAQVFEAMATDSTIARYDLSRVKGVRSPLKAQNPNALFYVAEGEGIAGRNIVDEGVAEELELTPGYNFQPRDDFHAMRATYHAPQAVGNYGTAILPFTAEVPTGLFARKVNKVSSNVCADVDSCNNVMKGGTPYMILSGRPIDIEGKRVDVSINTPSEATDTMRGTWVNMLSGSTQYVLDQGDTQYFQQYKEQIIPALTAYLEYTQKVRATSKEYNLKDKKARVLAQTIGEALGVLEAKGDEADKVQREALEEAIAQAEAVLREEPELTMLSSEVKSLEASIATFEAGIKTYTKEGYLDCSGWIVNPSFEATSAMSGWTRSSTTGVLGQKTTTQANYMVGADGVTVAYIKKDQALEQTLTEVANGTYRMVVSVAADYGNHIRLSANGVEADYEATDFGPYYLTEATLGGIKVTDGRLTIGASGVEGWAKVDNFHLYQTEADEATGIETMGESQGKARMKGIYDLQGRRLKGVPERGVYIENGKLKIEK